MVSIEQDSAPQEKAMTNGTEELTRHDLEAKIVKRCWEDEAFRAEFLADPAGAFVEYLDVPAASLPRIVVHEEPAGSWHIVLPVKPSDTDELSEDELEKISGGTTPACVSAVAVTISTTIVSGAGVSAASFVVTKGAGGW
jgi:hypothetical protein